jgi:hypothetical protein
LLPQASHRWTKFKMVGAENAGVVVLVVVVVVLGFGLAALVPPPPQAISSAVKEKTTTITTPPRLPVLGVARRILRRPHLCPIVTSLMLCGPSRDH